LTETNTTPAFPPGRYGRRRQRRPVPRWVPVALGAVVVLLGLVAAVLLGQNYGPGRPYDATVERFFDLTDERVTVQFTVVVPEGEAAVCVVRARAYDGREVGREEVRVAPSPGVTRPVVVHRLATTDRPVTGEVQRCWRDPS
jgi:hypothetical protein